VSVETLTVLYRDRDLLLIDKPSGLIVHRGWARDHRTALRLARELAGCWVYPAHRLDRATSGVLAFALSPEVASVLSAAFAAGEVDKRYLALTRGLVAESGLIDHAIAKRPGGERRAARTSYRRLGCFERYSWVEACPHTGRLHQVRRHLKHISHPIIGDTRYGDGAHNRAFRARFGLHRLALHAAALRFRHPVTGQMLSVQAPLPPDLLGPLSAMGLSGLEASVPIFTP